MQDAMPSLLPVKRQAVAYPALHPGTVEWTERRRKVIGASEVAALFGAEGQDEWKSPFQIWLDKTGQMVEEPRSADSPSSIGSALERPIADIYHRVNREIVGHIQPAWTEHDREVPVLCATPDFDCFNAVSDSDRSHAVQIKNRGGWPRGWGDQWSDAVPRPVLLQVHAELTVTELPWIDVAVLLSGNQFRCYRIRKDEDISAEIRTVVDTFWRTHVEADVPPTIAGNGASDYFKRKFSQAASEKVRMANGRREVEALERLKAAHAAYDAAEMEKKNSIAVCQSIIGADKGLELVSVGRALWSNTKGRETLDKEELLLELISKLGRENAEALVSAATKTGGSSAPLPSCPLPSLPPPAAPWSRLA